MDNEQPKFKPRTMSWAAYYRLDEIYSWFDDLAAAYPDKVTLVEGGSSYEGRKIRGLIYATNPVSEKEGARVTRFSFQSAHPSRTIPECSSRVECMPASGSARPPPPTS